MKAERGHDVVRNSKTIAAVVTGIGLVLTGCGQSAADGTQAAASTAPQTDQPSGQATAPGPTPDDGASAGQFGDFGAECGGKWQAEFVDVPYEAWSQVRGQAAEAEQPLSSLCPGGSDLGFGVPVSVLAPESPLAAKARELAISPEQADKARQNGDLVERVVFSRLSAERRTQLQQEVAEFVAQAGGSGYTRYAPQRDALEFFGPTSVAKQVTEHFAPTDVFANLEALGQFEQQFTTGEQAQKPYVPFHVWLEGGVNAIGHTSSLQAVQTLGDNVCLTWAKEGREELVLLPVDFRFVSDTETLEGLPEPGTEFLHGPWVQLGPAACGGKVWAPAVALSN